MTHSTIAITGIGCRLPGANTVDEFWNLISSGRNTFKSTAGRDTNDNNFVAVASYLDKLDMFEPEFFGITTHDALVMDPQQRVLLETVWSAIEDGGYASSIAGLKVGVFTSVSNSTYLSGPLTQSGRWDETDPSYPIMIGNDKDFAAARISYTFGFTGPTFAVQSACSSSLVAAYTACQALASGQCELAIVAAASISLPFLSGYRAKPGSIFSPSGLCRPFSDVSDGTVKGNGAVAVVLRPSAAANATNDRAYAEIAGWGINNDGNRKTGMAAPSVIGQREAIQEALIRSGISPASVGYFETHGTGTRIGDPIELRALIDAYQLDDQPGSKRPYIGSIKATMGHLDAAAGVAGLAKTALVLHYQRVPPLAGFTRPNPLIEPAMKKIILPSESTLPPGSINAASVTSLGMGGTNVHAILTHVPVQQQPSISEGTSYTVQVSARTKDSLESFLLVLKDWVAHHPRASLAEIAETLASRKTFDIGVIVDARTPEELISKLLAATPQPIYESQGLVDGAKISTRQHPPLSLPPYQWSRQRYFVNSAEKSTKATVVRSSIDTCTTTLADCQSNTLRAMRQILENDSFGLTEDFFDSGGDSLSAIDLIDTLKADHPDLLLTFDDVERNSTASELGEVMYQCLSGSPQQRQLESNTVALSTVPPRNHLFLVHPAGGSVLMYRDLARHLSNTWEVTGLSFPRSLLTEPCSLRELAAEYAESIRAVQPSGPFYLGGYSLGGNLSIEIAKILEADGHQVPAIVMYDSFATSDYNPTGTGTHTHPHAVETLMRYLPAGIDILHGSTSSESPAAREVDVFLEIWKHNQEALASWTPDHIRVSSQLLLLRATTPFPSDIAEAVGFHPSGPDSWRDFTTGELVIEDVEASHYTLFDDPLVVAAMAVSTSRFLAEHSHPARTHTQQTS